MFIIVLNTTNIVPNGLNNTLVYQFPNSVNLKDKYVAVAQISLYYSWFNISTFLNNNVFTYTWTAGTTTTTYTITIPNGLYDITDINFYCQFVFIQNGTYWSDQGDNFYPFELLVNAPRYAVQLNTYLIPIAPPTATTITPSNFPGWPTSAQNPVVIFPTAFNQIVGYVSNFTSNGNVGNPSGNIPTNNYQSKDQATGTISYLSTTAPNVQPNNSVLFSLSGVSNPYTQPSSIVYSINPNVNAGEQISVTPPNYAWNAFIPGTYSELRLTLLGNDLQPLQINDPNMTILLVIRDKDENLLSFK